MFYSNKNKPQSQQLSRTQDILNLIAHKTNCEPKLYRRGYLLRCPAHEDKKPSLSVSEGSDGRVLLYCFVGCDFRTVCDAVDLDPRDLFPKKTWSNR